MILSIASTYACDPEPDFYAVAPEQSVEQVMRIPFDAPRTIDLLLVIDDSPSMELERAALADNIARFAQVIDGIEGGRPDLHLGIVTTSVPSGYPVDDHCGDAGGWIAPSECPLADTPYLRDHRPWWTDQRERNYQGTFAEQLACMAAVGTEGCEFSQPLEAVVRALGERPDFHRPGAMLAIVIITDGDDCSAADPALFDDQADLGPVDSVRCVRHDRLLGDVADYFAELAEIEPDPSFRQVALVSGPDEPAQLAEDPDTSEIVIEPACSLEGQVSAEPAPRLHRFIERFPQRYSFESMCSSHLGVAEWSGVLTNLVVLLSPILFVPCVPTDVVDVDADNEGLQPLCSLTIVSADRTERPADECVPGQPGLCYRWVESDICESGLELHFQAYQTPVPPGSHGLARCLAH